MNMYNDRVNIVIIFFVASRVQSYDIISKTVSVAYGKHVSKMKRQTTTNQLIMDKRQLLPMEISTVRVWKERGFPMVRMPRPTFGRFLAIHSCVPSVASDHRSSGCSGAARRSCEEFLGVTFNTELTEKKARKKRKSWQK